jgi:8-hydroxy-5-deazaflavin:NADPH oxidoreductase
LKIAIIGAGNVGGALALGWAKAGHEIIIGAKNPNSDKVKKVISQNSQIKVKSVKEAAKEAEVILIAASAPAVPDISKSLGDVKNKIIIDAMNSIAVESAGYQNSFEALKSLTNCENIVKCFNTTGFENMINPKYGNITADMFVAGNSIKGKQIATQLAKDIRFAECYDLGGDHRVEMLEQLAMMWVNLALIQKQGRNIAFKILKRN